MTDRIFGAAALIAAMMFVIAAMRINPGLMSGPIGPSAFPIFLGVIGGLCGLGMILSPEENPGWPRGAALVKIIAGIVILVLYAECLTPLGFLVSTALAAAGLSYLIGGRPVAAAVTGLALSIGLFLFFRTLLGLSLSGFPSGW